MIPMALPNLGGNEARYLAECVSTNFVSSVGPFVGRFERLVAEAAGTRHAVATSAGTTALHLALVGLGVQRDDLVVLPSLTFIASANAISHAGASPWLFDVEPTGWTLDAGLVSEHLHSETRVERGVRIHVPTGRRVAAMMPVHTLGNPADMAPLRELATEFGLPLVADAAPALGATYRGTPVAAHSDLSVFSFNGNKTVTAGGGGIVAGDDAGTLATIRHLSTQARSGTAYEHDRIGYNYRMTNLQAAVGCAQMEQLADFLAAKRTIAARYREALADTPLAPLPSSEWGGSAHWLSGFVVEDPSLPAASAWVEALAEREVMARPFWKPMHLQPPYRDCPHTPMPLSESVWDRVLTLPCSTGLTEEDQETVVRAVREVLALFTSRPLASRT